MDRALLAVDEVVPVSKVALLARAESLFEKMQEMTPTCIPCRVANFARDYTSWIASADSARLSDHPVAALIVVATVRRQCCKLGSWRRPENATCGHGDRDQVPVADPRALRDFVYDWGDSDQLLVIDMNPFLAQMSHP